MAHVYCISYPLFSDRLDFVCRKLLGVTLPVEIDDFAGFEDGGTVKGSLHGAEGKHTKSLGTRFVYASRDTWDKSISDHRNAALYHKGQQSASPDFSPKMLEKKKTNL